jgi:hypothetical protein
LFSRLITRIHPPRSFAMHPNLPQLVPPKTKHIKTDPPNPLPAPPSFSSILEPSFNDSTHLSNGYSRVYPVIFLSLTVRLDLQILLPFDGDENLFGVENTDDRDSFEAFLRNDLQATIENKLATTAHEPPNEFERFNFGFISSLLEPLTDEAPYNFIEPIQDDDPANGEAPHEEISHPNDDVSEQLANPQLAATIATARTMVSNEKGLKTRIGNTVISERKRR